MTVALEGGEWWAACPGRTLPAGKTRYPFYRRLGEPQGWSGRVENLVPTGIRSRTVQPVVSCYTDWATQPKKTYSVLSNISADTHGISDLCLLSLSVIRKILKKKWPMRWNPLFPYIPIHSMTVNAKDT